MTAKLREIRTAVRKATVSRSEVAEAAKVVISARQRPREGAETRSFAVCIHNGDYAGTLDLRKVYEVLEDAGAETRNSLRVIDESGHDYLYPNAWFVPIVVPETAAQLLHELAVK
jgi:hypothetical protein